MQQQSKMYTRGALQALAGKNCTTIFTRERLQSSAGIHLALLLLLLDVCSSFTQLSSLRTCHCSRAAPRMQFGILPLQVTAECWYEF
jgi:hypothetical protein